LSVVAEGIEERAHYEVLRELGCDVGQGYWIARPMPAEQLLVWSQAWDRGRPLQQSVDRQAGASHR
jgi:EAL domain-containing protein (putative c-di-GMP-specific phosphodiesterase class I)